MKQKHAALIKAWADGAKIQTKNEAGEWIDINFPDWLDGEYRLKPKEKRKSNEYNIQIVRYKDARLGFNYRTQRYSDKFKPNVKIKFDSYGKLMSVEMLP
jgi:hypothetical protein